jgi:hypothetical protein
MGRAWLRAVCRPICVMTDAYAPTPVNAEDPWAEWRGRIAAARTPRDVKVAEWRQNVSKRKGERIQTTTDALSTTTTGTPVNKDWPLTKAKIALLYSQTPEIRLTSKDPRVRGLVQQFAKDLNETIQASNVGPAIEEELADVVNAAGLGGVIVACEKRTETVQMPAVDPMIAGMTGLPTEMKPVTRIADSRYPVRRISPTQLLIPTDFAGSVYDDAKWLGYEDSMTWATAQVEFGLTDDDKEHVLGADPKARSEATLRTDPTAIGTAEPAVTFVELYYWRHYYHAEETSFAALQRVVFVEGLDEPVVNEPYAGQVRTQDGRVAGVLRNPIQILTLTYISDENLPPSDSTISRSQVSELERSRSHMELQRKHSLPANWFDATRVSPNTRAALEKGTYQGWLPSNGPGDRAFGQVSRSQMGPEKYELDQVVDREITDQWQVGPNQSSQYASGERSAREASIVDKNFQTRIGQERSKVERHLVAIAEVLGGLMALHGKTPFPPALIGSMAYSVRVDSTVLLSAEQQIARLERVIDRLAQSPYADATELISQWLELNGIDPSGIVKPPQPKAPDPVKVSVSKAEDLRDPLFVAMLMRTGQGPTPEDVKAAVALLAELGLVPPVPPPSGVSGVALPPPEAGADGPPRETETPGMANPEWQMAPRMDKRDVD